MKVKKQMAVLVVLLVFAVSSVFASGAGMQGLLGKALNKAPDVRNLVVSALIDLDLTKAQKEEIRSLVRSTLEANKALVLRAVKARKEVREAIHADSFNEQAVRAAFKKSTVYGEELAVVRAKAVSQIKTCLTEEQKTVLKQLKTDIQGLFNPLDLFNN